MEELIVRVHSLLDRNQLKKEKTSIKIGVFTFNPTEQLLVYQTESMMLTHRESQLLYELSEHRNTILDKTFILTKLWGNDDFFSARSMDVFISKLRKKLQKDKNIQIINCRGFGYKLIC